MRFTISLFAKASLFACFAVACCAVIGCASDETKPAETPTTEWSSGSYLLTAHAVTDGCLDGAADLVALPDGNTREFTNPLSFPGSADDTFTTSLALVAPFTAVDVTFTKSGENTWTWEPASNDAVALGELSDAWNPCTADFDFGGEFTAEQTEDGKVRFVGTTSFILKTADGDACPALVKGTPCTVALDMIASPQ